MEMYRIVGSVEATTLPLVRMTVPMALLVNGRGRRPWFVGKTPAATDYLFDARAYGVRIPIQHVIGCSEDLNRRLRICKKETG